MYDIMRIMHYANTRNPYFKTNNPSTQGQFFKTSKTGKTRKLPILHTRPKNINARRG